MNSEIKVPTGTVVGIGKIKVFTTKEFEYEIPTLSFLVAKNGDEYTGTCINLCLDCSAKNLKDVCDNLKKMCNEYLVDLFNYNKENAWEQLAELFTSDAAKDFRDAYYRVQIELAKQGVKFASGLEEYYKKKYLEAKEMLEYYQKKTNQIIQVDVVDYQGLCA